MNINDALEKIDNGDSLMIGELPDSHEYALFPVDLVKLNELLEYKDYVFAFSLAFRCGNALFQRYLELTYFHPSTEDNKLLVSIFHKWQDMLWVFTGVPRKWKDEDKVYDGESYLLEAVDYAGLRVVKDSFPMIIGGDNPNAEFEGVPSSKPLFNTTNVLYLENKSDHLIYTDRDAAEKEEASKIAELEMKYLGGKCE